MMECADSLELLSEYHAESLDEHTRVEVRSHLTACTTCAEVYDDIKVIVETTYTLLRSDSITFPDENILWQRIHRAAH